MKTENPHSKISLRWVAPARGYSCLTPWSIDCLLSLPVFLCISPHFSYFFVFLPTFHIFLYFFPLFWIFLYFSLYTSSNSRPIVNVGSNGREKECSALVRLGRHWPTRYYTMLQCNPILYNTIVSNTIQCNTMYNVLQYNAIQYCTIQ